MTTTGTPGAAPGWYPIQGPYGNNQMRYWDGRQWLADQTPFASPGPIYPTASPAAPYPPRRPAPVPVAISGISLGENLVHCVLTVLTFGVWGVAWWLRWKLKQQRIITR